MKPVLGDEGVTAVGAWRVASGQIPERDFFELVPPLSFWIPGFVFRLFGPSVAVFRAIGVLYGILLLMGVWSLAARFLRHPLAQSVPLALLIPFGVGVWPFPSHHWLVTLLQVYALVCLDKAQEEGSPLWPFAGGCLLGGGLLTMQDQGGYGLIGFIAALFFLEKGRRRDVVIGTLSGCGLVSAGFLLPLAASTGVSRFFEDWVVFPLTRYEGVAANVVTLAKGWSQVLARWNPAALRVAPVYSTLIAALSMVVYALPLLALAGLAAAWFRKWLPRGRWALLAAFSCAFVAGAWHRWALTNLIWAAAVPATAFALLLDHAGEGKTAIRRTANAVSGLLVAACLLFGALRIALVLRGPLHTIRGPAGSYRTFNPREARDVQEFADAIGRLVPAGAPAFCKGYISLVSFLTLHPNPTRYTILLTPGYNTPAQVEDWVGTLESGHVEWGFSPNAPINPEDPADAYLQKAYSPAWSNRSFILWRRKG